MTGQISRAATRVLMVEDNPLDVDLLRRAFDEVSDWPVETELAEDGEKAIDLLLEKAARPNARPDLVILDLNLPRRDGSEVLQLIRTTHELANLPVAVLSSSPRDVVQRKLTAAGVTADGHFTKPLGYTEFIHLGQVLRGWYEEQTQRRQSHAGFKV
jgi:CheY-like chemotaxis protein